MYENNKAPLFRMIKPILFSFMLALIVGLSFYFSGQAANDTDNTTNAQNAGIVIVAAGDWDDKFGASGATQRTITAAVQANPDLIAFVGDLSYDGSDTTQAAGTATARTWCSRIKPFLGNIPTAFTPGDHDSWLQDGNVTIYDSAECLNRPTGFSGSGVYPWLYYFDITKNGATVRVVGSAGDASGDLADAYPNASQYMTGYQRGGASYNFLNNAFADAQNKGYWTVYLNHEPCIDPGKDNPGGEWCGDLVDLMSDTGVDVMITASSHNAWLTKQVSKGTGCSTITLNGKGSGYNAACVKSPANNAFIEGQGFINAHAGTAGKNGSSSYDCLTGADVPFVVPGTCGGSGSDGALHLTITTNSIAGNFKKNAGGSLYTFTMTKSGAPPPTIPVPSTGTSATIVNSPPPTATVPHSTVPPVSGPPTNYCLNKKIGDANCQSNTKGEAVDILDYAVWYSEFINGCSSANLAGCGSDNDGNGYAMDANFNYPGTSYMVTDMKVDIFDYAVWIQGLAIQNQQGATPPTSTPPPGTAPTSTPPSGGSTKLPSQVLNLANWKITTPYDQDNNKVADEVKQPQLATYTDQFYFHTSNAGDSVVFRANAGGATTSGSGYARSELREMLNNGTTNAAWSTSSGTHTMTVDMKVTRLPPVKPHMVIAQIHGGSDDLTVFRVEGNNLFVQVGNSDQTLIDGNFALNTRFTIKFEVQNNIIKYFYKGQQVHQVTASSNENYFKTGAYIQSACRGSKAVAGEDCNSFGAVEIYNVQVTHN